MKIANFFWSHARFWGLVAGVFLPLMSGFGADLSLIAASDFTLSKYSSNGMFLIGQTHVGRIFIDHEHWAFFRIGFLPMLVAERVQVQIESAEFLTNGLDDLESWRPPSVGARQLELRQLEIIIGDEKQPRLRAATAHIGSGGELKLTNALFQPNAGPSIFLPKATFQIMGPSAGTLYYNLKGRPENCQLCRLWNVQKP